MKPVRPPLSPSSFIPFNKNRTLDMSYNENVSLIGENMALIIKLLLIIHPAIKFHSPLLTVLCVIRPG